MCENTARRSPRLRHFCTELGGGASAALILGLGRRRTSGRSSYAHLGGTTPSRRQQPSSTPRGGSSRASSPSQSAVVRIAASTTRLSPVKTPSTERPGSTVIFLRRPPLVGCWCPRQAPRGGRRRALSRASWVTSIKGTPRRIRLNGASSPEVWPSTGWEVSRRRSHAAAGCSALLFQCTGSALGYSAVPCLRAAVR